MYIRPLIALFACFSAASALPQGDMLHGRDATNTATVSSGAQTLIDTFVDLWWTGTSFARSKAQNGSETNEMVYRLSATTELGTNANTSIPQRPIVYMQIDWLNSNNTLTSVENSGGYGAEQHHWWGPGLIRMAESDIKGAGSVKFVNQASLASQLALALSALEARGVAGPWGIVTMTFPRYVPYGNGTVDNTYGIWFKFEFDFVDTNIVYYVGGGGAKITKFST